MGAALVAGAVNAIAGAGTLLTFPALLYTGLASIAANATSTLALWPGSVTSAWTYRRYLRRDCRLALILAVPSLVGGLVGAVLLLQTPERLFRSAVPFLIYLACGLLILQEPVGQWMTQRALAHPRHRLVALWIVQLGIAVYGGYFGAGIGILMLAAMAIFLPEDLQAANALKNLQAALINSMAMLYFIASGAASVRLAVPMAVAAVVGGYIGAHAAQRLPARWLRTVVVLYGLGVATYLMVE